MPCQPRPEAEEEPQGGDTAQRLQTIERWLQHAEEELLYTPDAQGEAATTPRDPAKPSRAIGVDPRLARVPAAWVSSTGRIHAECRDR